MNHMQSSSGETVGKHVFVCQWLAFRRRELIYCSKRKLFHFLPLTEKNGSRNFPANVCGLDTLTRRDFFYATISLIFLTFAKNESRAFVVAALFPGGAKGRRKTKLPEICQPSGNVLFLLQLLDMLISQLFLPCCRILIRCDVAREKYLRGK